MAGGIWTRLFPWVGGAAVAGAATAAASPVVELARQDAWALNAFRVLDPEVLGQLIAQALVTAGDADEMAKRSGYDHNKLNAYVQIALKAPPVAEALELWRRNRIEKPQVLHALEKAQIEPQYHDAILHLFDQFLGPADVANAIQQGFLPNDGILPSPNIPGPPYEPPTDEIALDSTDEAQAHGIDADRLKVLAQLAGLPPGPMELLQMLNRGIITPTAFEHGVREGHTKTKWTRPLLALRHAVLSAPEYATLRLKGWITRDESITGGALTGHSAAQMDLMYLARGRPAAPGQMATAVARGIDGPDGVPMNFAQFEKGIRESDIRPEWAAMLWGIRYAYPPLFQINRLVAQGAATPAEGLAWATKDRYAPEVLAALQRFWAQGGAAGTKELTKAELAAEYEGLYITESQYVAALEALGYLPDVAQMEAHVVDAKRVAKARDQVVTRIHAQYVGHKIARADAAAYLNRENIPEPALDLILIEWDHEREVNRAALTPTEIVNAYRRGIITEADAIGQLEERGYSATDAAERLGVSSPLLTVKQVKDAVDANLMSRPEAIARLMLEGYSAADASILLSE